MIYRSKNEKRAWMLSRVRMPLIESCRLVRTLEESPEVDSAAVTIEDNVPIVTVVQSNGRPWYFRDVRGQVQKHIDEDYNKGIPALANPEPFRVRGFVFYTAHTFYLKEKLEDGVVITAFELGGDLIIAIAGGIRAKEMISASGRVYTVNPAPLPELVIFVIPDYTREEE